VRVQIWYIRCIQCRWVKTPTPNGLPSETLVYRILWGHGVPFRYTVGAPPHPVAPSPRGAQHPGCRAYCGAGPTECGACATWCRAGVVPGLHARRGFAAGNALRAAIPSPNRPGGRPCTGTPTPYAMQFFGLFIQTFRVR